MRKLSIQISPLPFLLIALLVIGLSLVICVYAIAFSDPEFAQKNGALGDYIGGILNPALTFLSFFGIIVSIALQRMDLSLSRNELQRSANALEKQIQSIENQNFEAAFFQMLNSYTSIVSSIDLLNVETNRETKGRDCFRIFYTRLNKIYRENVKKSAGRYDSRSAVRLSYFTFWKDAQSELSHYFRFLFNIFRFLDESKVAKQYHAKILRAQLSDQELLLLFYNCTSEHGKAFQYYAIKYELFDNLPTVRLLDPSHIEMIDSRAYGNNPMYNSRNIRESFNKETLRKHSVSTENSGSN